MLRGYSFETATKERVTLFPEYEKEIKIYYDRWEDMLGGAITETVSVLDKLIKLNQHKIVALTNWSAETFPIALERYEFLHWFEGIVVSGVEKTRKPFKDIYDITLKRFNITPEHSVFIDDNLRNIEAANSLNINGIHFESSEKLIQQLNQYNINL